jgi:hypothetical protein
MAIWVFILNTINLLLCARHLSPSPPGEGFRVRSIIRGLLAPLAFLRRMLNKEKALEAVSKQKRDSLSFLLDINPSTFKNDFFDGSEEGFMQPSF